nr:leucine-rich repeat-containing protein [Tanacetum cinerariifolium]
MWVRMSKVEWNDDSNLIQGSFPPSICNMSTLVYLDMSNNSFGGLIPQCVGNVISMLALMDLSNNHFQGTIPNVHEDCRYLQGLILNGNQGEVPSSFSECQSLRVVDVGNNQLNGNLGLCGFLLYKKCTEQTRKPQLEAHGNHEEKSGFTWEVVTLGYGCGTLLGLVMGYLMLSTRRVKWFNTIADAGEHMVLQLNKRKYNESIHSFRIKVVNDKLAKLDLDLTEMACYLEQKIYPHLLNTISSRRWLLTHGLKLFLVKCLNSSEYLTDLETTISRVIEKGMQSCLAASVDHGKEGMSLVDVATYNPDAEADFNFALQKFREVDFPLLAELKSHKDASTKDIMNMLRLEGALADAPGMNDLQPDIEQLKVPIHRSEDQMVLSETSLSFALSVLHSRVERIKENIATQCSIPPNSTDDYEIVCVDGQEGTGTDGRVVANENVVPFPNIDDVELNISQ